MLNTTLIKSAMVGQGLNQTALAEKCSVSKESVSNWLAGESIPRPNKLKSLAVALQLEVERLFAVDEADPTPLIAFRTKRNRPVTGPALEAAEDLAAHLRALVPFVRSRPVFAPPVLEDPQQDDEYIREAARQVRARIGLAPKAPLSRAQLLGLLHDFGALLVPVLWDSKKAGHENALSVFLPESGTSWVVFSLNSRDDDFNYWLAHELGHCYSLHALQGAEGEAFAERFAQELLFPMEVAVDALCAITSDSQRKERATWYAGSYGISVVTVFSQADRAARVHKKEPTGLNTRAFWADWQTNRVRVPTVVESTFGVKELSAEEYVLKSEDEFSTPVFRALAQWQVAEGGRDPSFIASALNIGIGQAQELSHLLMRLHSSSGEPGASPNSN
ncbi:MAG: helix-turn-helix domain-containing protein [Thiobacillus sp.]|nr:helix-turn-helix domain-containing protein [Thiobacillus sp.]